jgi:hypothetical protein
MQVCLLQFLIDRPTDLPMRKLLINLTPIVLFRKHKILSLTNPKKKGNFNVKSKE